MPSVSTGMAATKRQVRFDTTDHAAFMAQCGGVFYSPWVAERAFEAGDIVEPLTSGAVHSAMCKAFRAASRDSRLAVLRACPDLAGKLAIAGKLPEDSRREQAGAGLDRLNAEEHAEFTRLNGLYTSRFGFPFIIAVKGLDKHDILVAFRDRVVNSVDEEFAAACEQVEKIARRRLDAILPAWPDNEPYADDVQSAFRRQLKTFLFHHSSPDIIV